MTILIQNIQTQFVSPNHTTAFIAQSHFVSPKTFMSKRLHLKAVQQRPRHRHKSYVYVGGHQAQAAGSHLLGISSVLSASQGRAWTLFVVSQCLRVN